MSRFASSHKLRVLLFWAAVVTLLPIDLVLLAALGLGIRDIAVWIMRILS